MTAVMAAVIMGDSMLYNVLPSNVAAFGVPAGLVGVLLSANRFVRLASNPLAAWAFQRFGLDKPFLFSIVLSVGTTVAYGAGHGFAVLLLARVLWGVCYSMLRLGGYLVVLEVSPESARGRLMGFFSGGGRAGSVVGVLLGGLLFDLAGRTSSFLIIAGLGLLGLPALLALGRDYHGPTAVGRVTLSPDPSEAATHPVRRSHRGIWDLLLSPVPELSPRQLRQLLAVDLTIFVFYFVMTGVLVSTLGFYLSDELGEEGATIGGVVVGIATLNGVLLATNWIAALGTPYLGHLGDRFGRESVLLIAVPVCIVGLLLLSYPVLLLLTLLWLPIAFIGAAATHVSLDTLAGGLAPAHRRAQVMSRYATWQDLGSAAGPLLAYAVLGFTSSTWVYASSAVLLGAACAVFVAAFRGNITNTFRKEDADRADIR